MNYNHMPISIILFTFFPFLQLIIKLNKNLINIERDSINYYSIAKILPLISSKQIIHII